MADFTHPLFLHRSLGITKLAVELRKHGYEVLTINHLHVFSFEELEEILKKSVSDQTVYVGFSTYFYKSVKQVKTINEGQPWEQGGHSYGLREIGAFLPHGLEYNDAVKDLIKSINPNCKLVLGGPDVHDSAEYSVYDYIVFGYAEASAINLANHLSRGEPLLKARKSLFGPIIVDDSAAAGHDFVGTQVQFSEDDIILPGETLTLETSRGCIFKCKFCSFPLLGKKKNDYIKHEDILYAELIENYEKFGVTRYLFADDTFNDTPEKVDLIYNLSKRLPFELEYWAYIRLDLLVAFPETISKLFDSGCRATHFGIETFNQETGKIIGKGGNREKMIQTIHAIKAEYGKSVCLASTFIFGLPHESVESLRETGELLSSGASKLDTWNIKPLRIHQTNRPFVSELERDYPKYGYKLLELDRHSNMWIWENEQTSYHECAALSQEYNSKGFNEETSVTNSQEVFWAATSGIDFKDMLNKPISKINWPDVADKKAAKSLEYKQKLCAHVGLSLDAMRSTK